MDVNPYQTPAAIVADPVGDDADVALRQAHLRHEVQLKSVSSLYFLLSLVLGLAGASVIASVFLAGTLSPWALGGVVYLAIAVGLGTVAVGFRRLRPWVRIPGGILSTLGLLGFPVGTLINGWILFLMFGAKGRVVLSPGYQRVIEATPQLRYQRTLGDWIALALVVGLLLLLVVAIALPALSH